MSIEKNYHIGDVLPDGWIVGPVSPDTGKPMGVEPLEGSLEGYKTWDEGEKHAAELRNQGHANARLPSAGELSALYNDVVKAEHDDNAKLLNDQHGVYWSSTTNPDNPDGAWVQYFSNSFTSWYYKDDQIARTRCVRDEPDIRLEP
jgi:hypothetical protein